MSDYVYREAERSWSWIKHTDPNKYINAHTVYANLGDILMGEFGGLQGQCLHIDDWSELHGEAYDIMEEGFRKAAVLDIIKENNDYHYGDVGEAIDQLMLRDEEDG